MSTITGTITSGTLVNRSWSGSGTSTRDLMETWMITANFAAYTGASDVAQLTTVAATISNYARDGRTRTLLWGAPAGAGADANNQAVTFGGTSVAAATVSSDSLTGQLNTLNAAATEITTTSGTTNGVTVMVGVYVT